MKQRVLCPILILATASTSIVAHHTALAQSSNEWLFDAFEQVPIEEVGATDYESDPAVEELDWLFNIYFEGITLTPEQRSFAITALNRFNQAFFSFAEGQTNLGQTWSDAEANAFEEEFFNRLNAKLSSDQVQRVRQNSQQVEQMLAEWELTPEEQAMFEADIQQQTFEQWFEGVELTSEQEQFVRAEIARDHQALNELVDRAEAESGDIRDVTDAEFQALEDEFFARLHQKLSPEQIQKVQDNQARIAREIETELNQTN